VALLHQQGKRLLRRTVGTFLVEEIVDPSVVDLDVLGPDLKGGMSRFLDRGGAPEELVDDERDDTVLSIPPTATSGTEHAKGFAGSRLAVGKETRVVAFQYKRLSL